MKKIAKIAVIAKIAKIERPFSKEVIRRMLLLFNFGNYGDFGNYGNLLCALNEH